MARSSWSHMLSLVLLVSIFLLACDATQIHSSLSQSQGIPNLPRNDHVTTRSWRLSAARAVRSILSAVDGPLYESVALPNNNKASVPMDVEEAVFSTTDLPLPESSRRLLTKTTLAAPAKKKDRGPPKPPPITSSSSQLDLEENLVRLGWISLGGVTLMVVVLLTAYVLRKRKARWLPDSSVAMIFGMFVGLCVSLYDSPVQGSQMDQGGSMWTFSPKVFFFVLLPPIILDAGYSLKKRHFVSTMGLASLYAGPGLIISTLVVGLGALGASSLGAFGGSAFGLIESLMFGAMLSVTDSVATISILGSPELNIDSKLYSIVFGESVLNDAIGILTFDLLAKLSHSETSLTGFAASFVFVSCGSIILGVATGLLCSYMFKELELEDYPHFEFVFVLLFAYSSYVLALVMQLSGVMSLFACGAVLGHYNWYNISLPSRTSTKFGFKAFAVACEMVVFVYLGLTFSLSLSPSLQYRWSILGCVVTFFLVWLGRAAFVFPLSFLANFQLPQSSQITFPMQVIILAGGLRGAVSFALALNLHGEHYGVMVTTCLAIIIFTTLVCGSVTDRVVLSMSKRIAAESLPHKLPSASPRSSLDGFTKGDKHASSPATTTATANNSTTANLNGNKRARGLNNAVTKAADIDGGTFDYIAEYKRKHKVTSTDKVGHGSGVEEGDDRLEIGTSPTAGILSSSTSTSSEEAEDIESGVVPVAEGLSASLAGTALEDGRRGEGKSGDKGGRKESGMKKHLHVSSLLGDEEDSEGGLGSSEPHSSGQTEGRRVGPSGREDDDFGEGDDEGEDRDEILGNNSVGFWARFERDVMQTYFGGPRSTNLRPSDPTL